MPTLELLIDASGATRGAQQAEVALGRVKTAAEATATTTMRVGQSLSSAFQATSGSIQIAQGISQTATALGSLNTAAAAFSASRVLLEIGKTADDFRSLSSNVVTTTRDIYGLTSSTTRAVGVWTALGAVMRAHPLLTIASAIGAAASIMSLFGSETRKTSNDLAKMAEDLARIRATESVGAAWDDVSIGADAARRRAGRFRDAAIDIEANRDPVSALDLANSLRVSPQSIYDRLDRKPEIPFQPGSADTARLYLRRSGQYNLSPQQAVGVLRGFASESLAQIPPAATGFGTAAFDDLGFGRRNYVTQDASDRAVVEQEKRINDSQRVADNFSRAADYAGQIGDAFGSSLADVLFKTASLRQVFQSILQQSVRDGLGGIGRSIFSAAVSGLTPNQQGANAGIRKPGES